MTRKAPGLAERRSRLDASLSAGAGQAPLSPRFVGYGGGTYAAGGWAALDSARVGASARAGCGRAALACSRGPGARAA